jgi:hypothetical protein
MLMATQKKNPDASEAGLSAVEEALGLGGAAPADKKAEGPRLPRIDDIDIFKPEKSAGGEPTPEAKLEIKPPQRKAKPEKAPVSEEADFSARREPAAAPAEPVGETRRSSILPANDDRRASVSELLEPLRYQAPRTAYLVAGLFSLLWIAAAWLLLSKPDGTFFAADGALRQGIELPLALAGIGVILPILFVFALAALHRRSRELRSSARVMAEVAARLAEPENVGADAVFTLGQAVRREVSSIGDGVERALWRATELESIVHGEVSALERSYADNEYKMRQLVTELAAEREAIMATADRIRITIDAAHQGFTADIGKAGESISKAIDGASDRVTSIIGGKQDELVATLDRSTAHAGDLIRSRTTELSEALSSAAADTNATLEAASRTINLQLAESRRSVVEEIDRATRDASSGLNQATTDLSTRLGEQTQMIQQEIMGASQRAAEGMRISGAALTAEWENATHSASRHLTETSEASAKLIRESGAALKSEVTETAEVVNAAFQNNSRDIIENIGSRAIEINETMRAASADFIASMESRGIDTAKLIEEKGTAIVDQLTSRSDELADRMVGTASRIEDTLGTTSRAITGSMEETSRSLETMLNSSAQRINDTFGANGLQIETTLQRSIARIEDTLSLNTRSIETALESHRGGFESALATQGTALIDMIGTRVSQANEAFGIAGESLGALISDRTREATIGLKSELDDLGLALARQATEATERLAGTGRDVLQALNQHGAKVNEALAANAHKLADTVTERTAGLGDRFAQFEKTFVSTADKLEHMIVAQSDVLGARIAERTSSVANNLESLLSRVETGVDDRTRALGDMVALRTLEFTRVVNETGGALLGNLEQKVQVFTEKVVEPLEKQTSSIEARLDQSADSILLRAGEVERSLTALSRDVGSELMSRAEQISALIDEKGANFVANFDKNGREMVDGLETASNDIARRVTASLAELNAAIQSGSATSLHQLVEANDKLRGEVSGLLDKLGEANKVLNTIVGSTAKNLAEVEGRMGERVKGLEATLAAILSAASQGSDALVSRVEAIRSASGTLLANSQNVAETLDERATNMRAISSELAQNQAGLADMLASRQQAFEGLVNTLNGRIEDMDAMLRSFSSLVGDQLSTAESRAREASVLVHQSAEGASQAIASQYERIRLESGKERERTAAALRSAYEQANSEMSSLFQGGLDGFLATAAELREASREIVADLEATRAALQSGGLEIPAQAREASQQLKRVVGDQLRALNELNEIVSRSGPALDVAEPRRSEASERPGNLGLRGPAETPRAQPRPQPPVANNPRGSSWLSGLLERASDDEPSARTPRPSEAGSARRIESLDSLSVDIARMIDHEAAIELWDRYRRGERNVFTRKLYTLQGQEAYDDIRRRYRRDTEFKRTVDTYIDQFERLLAEVAGDDRDSLVARTYLTSDTGKVYTMLAHAAGRFD